MPEKFPYRIPVYKTVQSILAESCLHSGKEGLPESDKRVPISQENTFNFGYLPGGDHQIATQADTSIQAIEAGLRLLKKGGIMSLCIYSGGDSGFAEKEALLSYLETLDPRTFLVIVSTYYNRQNHPPIPAFVIRIKEERGE